MTVDAMDDTLLVPPSAHLKARPVSESHAAPGRMQSQPSSLRCMRGIHESKNACENYGCK